MLILPFLVSYGIDIMYYDKPIGKINKIIGMLSMFMLSYVYAYYKIILKDPNLKQYISKKHTSDNCIHSDFPTLATLFVRHFLHVCCFAENRNAL